MNNKDLYVKILVGKWATASLKMNNIKYKPSPLHLVYYLSFGLSQTPLLKNIDRGYRICLSVCSFAQMTACYLLQKDVLPERPSLSAAEVKTDLDRLAIPWPGKNEAATDRQLQACTSQHRCVGLLTKQDANLHHWLYPYCTRISLFV